jgi:hypothetical protein
VTERPLPVPDALSAGYWQRAARHEPAIGRCARCGRRSHPPDLVCPHCGSTEPDWTFDPIDGAGVIRSWTVVRRSFLPGFDVPFVLVDVELTLDDAPGPPAEIDGPDPGRSEGAAPRNLRLIGRLLDGPEAQLRIGAPVRVAFEDVSPTAAVPAFVLRSPQ